MADQSNKSNADPDVISNDEMLMMRMIEVCIGFEGDKWNDDNWAKIAANRGMNVSDAKRMFEKSKEKYLAAKRGESPIRPAIKQGDDGSRGHSPSQEGPAQQAGKEKSYKEQLEDLNKEARKKWDEKHGRDVPDNPSRVFLPGKTWIVDGKEVPRGPGG